MTTRPEVQGFFDPDTQTLTYLVSDPATREAIVVDPVLGLDMVHATLSEAPLAPVLDAIDAQKLTVTMVLETHLHADHVTGARVLADLLDVPVGIGEGVRKNLPLFRDLYGADDVDTDGGQFDRLLDDEERFAVGNIEARAMSTPGHTPGCSTYVIGDAAFVGDCLFMPDFGSARCDFPGGDARTLYASIQKILSLPDDTRLFTCHDYQPGGRELKFESSVREQRVENIHLTDGMDEAGFVTMREERDANLSLPRLILPAVQFNIRAGHLPPRQANGRRYVALPLGNFSELETDNE